MQQLLLMLMLLSEVIVCCLLKLCLSRLMSNMCMHLFVPLWHPVTMQLLELLSMSISLIYYLYPHKLLNYCLGQNLYLQHQFHHGLPRMLGLKQMEKHH